MPNWDNFVYSYVPRTALDNILEEGLFGGKALLKRQDLLEIAARGREQTAKQLESQIEKDLEAPEHESLLGPNVTFCLIPDLSILDRNHPVIKHKLIPIKINLTELLFDYPETKIFGLELEPFSNEVTEKERYHYLDRKELDFFLSMDAKEMWSRYNDIDGKGLYAPDVPHASIHTKDGIVPARYIEKISKKAQMNPSDLIDIVKQRVKKSDAVKKVFEKYKLDIDEIDLAPVCFADLDVSARTDHAIIYLNWQLLDGDPNNIDHYLAHEFTHFCQQTTGNNPTKGSTDDTYLDNPAEQEGFSAQTEYLSETRDPETAEEYIDQVLLHHNTSKKDIKKRKKQLLRLNTLQSLRSLCKIAQIDPNESQRLASEMADFIAYSHNHPKYQTLQDNIKQWLDTPEGQEAFEIAFGAAMYGGIFPVKDLHGKLAYFMPYLKGDVKKKMMGWLKPEYCKPYLNDPDPEIQQIAARTLGINPDVEYEWIKNKYPEIIDGPLEVTVPKPESFIKIPEIPKYKTKEERKQISEKAKELLDELHNIVNKKHNIKLNNLTLEKSKYSLGTDKIKLLRLNCLDQLFKIASRLDDAEIPEGTKIEHELSQEAAPIIHENVNATLPAVWYHGSPWCCMQSIADYQGDIMFITDSKFVAEEYTKPLLGTGKRLNNETNNGPVVYTLRLTFNPEQIFDTRRSDHVKLFQKLMKQSFIDDPEDFFRNSDIIRVPAARGSVISGYFPSFGIARSLLRTLVSHGFKAAFIGEGSQGASLAVLAPQQNLEIIGQTNFDNKKAKEYFANHTDTAQVSDKQLSLEFPMVRSKEELMRQYDDAVETGPKHNHNRNVIVRPISKLERQHRLERLQSLMQKLETKTSLEPMSLTKEAGLLKVPVALLQDVLVWLDSVYATYVKHSVLEKIKERNNFPTKEEISEIENKLAEAKYIYREGFVSAIMESRYKAFSVTNTIGKFPFSITLSRQKKDDAVKDRYGYIDEYGYLYNIDFKSNDVNVTQHNLDYDTAEKVIYQKIPEFFKKMENYIDDCNAARYLTDDTIVDEQLLLKECNRYPIGKKYFPGPGSLSDFTTDAKMFQYKNYFSDPRFAQYEVRVLAFLNGMQEEVKGRGHKDGAIGLWLEGNHPKNNDIWVDCSYQPSDVEMFNIGRQHIHSTARHELQHLVQSQIKFMKEKPGDIRREEGGLPSKKIRNVEYNIHGTPTSSIQGKERQEHALRDIEFYPRLSDEVQSFRNRYQYRKDNDKYELAKEWVGLIGSESSSFFKQLRENAPNKWKKAIKEFFKAIGD